jgi:sialate O-acetylesterase
MVKKHCLDMRVTLLLLFLLTNSQGFSLSKTLGDHMVLSRNGAVVYGFDAPGSTVTTILDGGETFSNITDASGVWRQQLAPRVAGGPHVLSFSSSSGGTAAISDVLFGDVYLCSGQSNAQFSVSAAFNATAEIATAIYPNIRIFTVGQGNQSDTPLTDLASVEQSWTAVTPDSVNGTDFGYFSAFCYFFARDLAARLGADAPPLGLISSSWGGTCLQMWTSPGITDKACARLGVDFPAVCYNAMIAPYLTGPMAVTGFLWSQGECNADNNQTAYYTCAFPLFVDGWRKEFRAPDAFFGFEVLPAYISDSTFSPYSLPYLREAQLTALTRHNVAACNAIDLGDATAPHGSVHPRDKQTVGARIADQAASIVYGLPVAFENLAYASAVASSAEAAMLAGTITVQVFFQPGGLASGSLEVRPKACPVDQGVPLSECSWYEVQTLDGVWHNASVSIAADTKSLLLSVATAGFGLGLLSASGDDGRETKLSFGKEHYEVNATRGNFSPWPVVVVYARNTNLPALPWPATVISGRADHIDGSLLHGP